MFLNTHVLFVGNINHFAIKKSGALNKRYLLAKTPD